VVGTGAGLRSQAVIGAILLTGATGVGALLGGHLPSSDGPRTVLRTYVHPPFEITRYPSPLVGFRKYTEGAQKVWDQELFTVSGPQAGSLVRIAVLDDYSGTVWSAAGGSAADFRKVGSTIAPMEGAPASTARATVTIGAAYAGLADVNTWVPSMGYPTTLSFAGPGAEQLADTVHYNPYTGQAIVPAKLSAGDRVTLVAAPIPPVTEKFTPGSGPTVSTSATDVVSAKTTKWAEKKPTPWEQVLAVAGALHGGAYSDGMRTGETQYLPGHGVARTTTFLGRQQIVGNDEQYASTFALMANRLGVPARVVMGAVVPEGGAVRGQDVHAWVEVQGSDGRWAVVPTSTFMPDRDKTPEQQPRATAKDSNAADVPPPNAQRPPGSVDATFQTTSASVRPPTLLERLGALPGWVLLLLRVIGYPLLALMVVAGVLAIARSARRRRRRRRGPASRRLAEGWRDYVDHARDLGLKVPRGLTRKEQASLVGQPELAAAADATVFGYGEPEGSAVIAYWAQITQARKSLTLSTSRRRRILRRFSVRGLLFRDDRPVEQLPRRVGHEGRRRRLPILRKAQA
jgi:hypothetical protein